ncbi:hypothetical protein M378DRAFT_174447 [Amanita muscaria Koide BX008]|uniref:Uncharacterized protein n=1 Tax=Amanita muscaria (strain Koide BX008) TaxID=946122 RepID=A0A0C2WDI6_AMAMK|nr:hypothetical protein M378DRAFT_174447 [Amanita muscaria Koide BX008]
MYQACAIQPQKYSWQHGPNNRNVERGAPGRSRGRHTFVGMNASESWIAFGWDIEPERATSAGNPFMHSTV